MIFNRWPPHMRRLAALLAILALGLSMRLLGFTDPWGHGTGIFGTLTGEPAQNFAMYGFFESKLVPYYFRLPFSSGDIFFDWYTRHPPLFFVISGLSLRYSGITEWALRLPPLLFSMLSLAAAYVLVKLVWGEKTAILSILFLAILPMATYHGMQPWVESAILLLYFLVLRSYVLWLSDRRRSNLFWMMLFLFIGGMLDWPMAFILPVILGHVAILSAVSGREKLSLFVFLSMATAAAVVLHALHLTWAIPQYDLVGDAAAVLGFQTKAPANWLLIIKNQMDFFIRGYSLPVAALTGVLLIRQFLLVKNDESALKMEWLLLLLIVPAISYILIFPTVSISHDFLLYYALPFVAIGLARLFLALDKRLPKPYQKALLYSFFLFCCAMSLQQGYRLWQDNRTTYYRDIARHPAVAPLLDDENTVIMYEKTRASEYLQLMFYSKAPIISYVESPEFLEMMSDEILNRMQDPRIVLIYDLSIISEEEASVEAIALYNYLMEIDPDPPRAGSLAFFRITN